MLIKKYLKIHIFLGIALDVWNCINYMIAFTLINGRLAVTSELNLRIEVDALNPMAWIGRSVFFHGESLVSDPG